MGDRITDTVRLLLAHVGLIGQTEGPCMRVFAPEADTSGTFANLGWRRARGGLPKAC